MIDPTTPDPADESSRTTHTHLPDRVAGLIQPVSPLINATRGQSEQIGFLLIITVLMMLFSMAQLQWAPQVQSEAEIEHASQVLSDYQEIHSNTIETAATGARGSSVLHLGTSYPSYLILAHPPDPSGGLYTESNKSLELRNARAPNDETADYLDGSTKSFKHTRLRYQPQYYQQTEAGDTIIEQGIVYQHFRSGERISETPQLVDGNRINLIASTGDIATARTESVTVDTVPLSASSQTVLVEPESSSDPFEISFESNLSESQWRNILSNEIDPGPANSPNNDKYISDLDKSGDTITITFETTGNPTYEIDTAKIGYKLGDQAAFSESENPDVKYLTTQQATNRSVQANGSIMLEVTANDRYANPKSTVPIEVNVLGAGNADRINRVTRNDGQAVIVYQAPPTATGTETVVVSIDDSQLNTSLGNDVKSVTFDIKIQD